MGLGVISDVGYTVDDGINDGGNEEEVVTMRLTGHEAIEYAEAHGLTLCKYADPVEDAREDLSVEDAAEIAREDPGLVYLDVDTVSVTNPWTGAQVTTTPEELTKAGKLWFS